MSDLADSLQRIAQRIAIAVPFEQHHLWMGSGPRDTSDPSFRHDVQAAIDSMRLSAEEKVALLESVHNYDPAACAKYI